MTDRPILFSTPMVRALLDGRKTQTRRLAWRFRIIGDYQDMIRLPTLWQKVESGDRFYVREKHWVVERLGQGGIPHLIYDEEWDGGLPDESAPLRPCGLDFGPRPGIHMFRWASRLTLVVTGTKIERLQDISEEDAKAEGVEPSRSGQWADGEPIKTYRTGFVRLWRELHGDGGWFDNPEVVALTFTVHKCNIDEPLAKAQPSGGRTQAHGRKYDTGNLHRPQDSHSAAIIGKWPGDETDEDIDEAQGNDG